VIQTRIHTKIQTKVQSTNGTSVLHPEERRRSHRVIIRVPLTLETTENDKAVQLSVHTIAVNVHGAMIVSPRLFGSGATIQIMNERTRQKTEARVTRAARESAEGFLIPIEFTSPSPNFWQISFPPENWKEH
jgi:hypothetical protein